MHVKNLNKLPKDILDLIYRIGKACDRGRVRGFVVGGFVRDLYLGIANLDLDIVLEDNAVEFAKELVEELGTHLICHHRFKTATICTFEKHKLDIATARKEIYEHPAALPIIEPSTIFEDLKRRDFTINTLAFSINKDDFGTLIDYFNGLADLKKKNIRILHELSFIDDPTRILRAIRFETRFNFKIEPDTLRLLKKSFRLNLLEKVEKQRIRDEIILLLKEKNPVACIKRIDDLIDFNFIHPRIEVDYKLLEAVSKQISWFNINFPKKRALDSWLLYFIALLDKLSNDDISHILRNFCFRRGESKRIRDYKSNVDKLIARLSKRTLNPSDIYKILEPLSYELTIMIRAKTLAHHHIKKNKIIASHIHNFFNIYNGQRLSVNGKDISNLGFKPGPYFKDILKKTLYAKIDGRLLSNLDEMEYLKACARKYINKNRKT
ncbi:MAG: hypothetical protein AB1755_01960 [Candidatus Omnitrophota bacterium]